MKRRLDWLLGSKGIRIVSEDVSLIILDKPAPFLVIPDRYDEAIPNIYRILEREFEKIYVVHRIDKETSGLVVFAKSAEVHKRLSEQFEGREVGKVYEAIVRGRPERAEGVIDLPIREKNSRPHVGRSQEGETVGYPLQGAHGIPAFCAS